MSSKQQRINLAGIVVDLVDQPLAIQQIIDRTHATTSPVTADAEPPLSVVSANLDHIAQFGRGGRWQETLGDSLRPTIQPIALDAESAQGGEPMEWLTLLDGAPLVAQATKLTGRSWPRLAGSDLIGPLLDEAQRSGATVGFLGGSYLIQRLLSRQLTRGRPDLVIAGMWSPDRADLADHKKSLDLARTIRESGAQLLIVGLGKPRQELWMAKYGNATGAGVLLAFGAVVDFLAGAIQRAPDWASEHGLEWAWRLALEPRRLARRYLVDDPPSLLQLRRDSSTISPAATPANSSLTLSRDDLASGEPDGSFVPVGAPADVVVYIVTYNSESSLAPLMTSLRREAKTLRLRVIVADNDSADGTLHELRSYPDAYTLSTGGNLGYASGINAAHRVSGDTRAVLVLNPDLEVMPGSITALHRRLVATGAGLVVPKLLETDGSIYESLRREPTVTTAFGDALFGAKWPTRPGWLAETDYASETYQHAHRIDWASGAALMVRSDLAKRLGDWDERFFLYSEEVDYFRRARETGETAWYEPASTMVHHGGGSGTSASLNALLAVNRVRYVRKYHDARYARWFRNGVALTELLRLYKPTRLEIFRTIMDEASWGSLPGPTPAERLLHVLDGFPRGTIIIPAHNEAAVIGRTLRSLQPVVDTGNIEVIVACNGCTDNSAEIARGFFGVTVLEVGTASKTAALNEADAIASFWPRLYLDADIPISPTTLRLVLERLKRGDVLAARPAYRYDDSGASWTVKSFYRARRRLPSTDEALWGAGAYGLTKSGHARFGIFPSLTADDLFIDQQFEHSEKAIMYTPPVAVSTPRTSSSLLAILRRNYRGQAEMLSSRATGGVQATAPYSTTRRTVRELVGAIHGPMSAFDALIYAGYVAAARLYRLGGKRTASTIWERDTSSRQ
ncbi:WecB/TagA/CpsF family glycosyltransferase [Arthrobacter rhombi]|uniref:N-acetylmannosaminyltransferase n=1 Tax=Arthrobacter rhombi TaxID=71253 RepID=A0A1R4GUC7_9MICC|nr:WecB/TagA/CpsF family glycosyltransferase [Arthrobacter rhombi]SJM71695.1 N-acetylmannosaminyltransferase [Arthrobacter rhombi]